MSPQCRGWSKSTFSDQGTSCVEVRFVESDGDGGFLAQVRNSRQPDGLVLVFDRAEWEAFELGVFNHEFEMPC